MSDGREQGFAANLPQPLQGEPPEAAVLELGVDRFDPRAAPVDGLPFEGLHQRPPSLDRLRLAFEAALAPGLALWLDSLSWPRNRRVDLGCALAMGGGVGDVRMRCHGGVGLGTGGGAGGAWGGIFRQGGLP